MAARTATVEELHAQWVTAFNAHDLDTHMALYREDATLFGAVDDLKIGRAAIRGYFGGRAPDVRVRSYPMPRVALLSPDVAVTAGHVDFAEGETLCPYRMTWVLVKGEEGWRIAQHHGSPRRGT